MSKILESLNDRQQMVVTTIEGPVLVMAGAGSGKTRALTYRIAYMIQEQGISPWNILAVTFTNKAANEMKERIAKILDKNMDDSSMPTVGTFHSICVRILKQKIHLLGFENSFTIYDTADQLILMKHVLEKLNLDEKQFSPRAMLYRISGAKNELITPAHYEKMVHNYYTEKVALIYSQYQQALHEANALDFDDIIMKTVELFQAEPQVLAEYQEKFRYISVDEYQDTNHAQYLLIKLLSAKYVNICVIGDSDQSIYGFRGANVGNILNFEKDYPGAKVILLEQNYRSTQHILDAAHSVIVKNSKRKEKRMWTERDGGEKIKFMELDNERAEAEFVAREIRARMRAHEYPDYREFAVLYRTNAQSRVVEEVMLRYGIPYKIVGGIRFYERKEVKDLVAYLRVIQNPVDTVSLFRIINTPHRKIGAKTIEAIQAFASAEKISVFEAMSRVDQIQELPVGKVDAILHFVKIIRDLQAVNTQFPASGVIKYVFDYTGYRKHLDDGTAEGVARIENVHELVSVASRYDQLEPGLSLNIFLEEISLIADVDTLDYQDNAVTMMTIHSAKGLEFPVVFIIGLEDGVLPHSRSLLEREELEEERRLMYVAMTRARHKLYLLRAKNRTLYGETQSNAASQFIADIPSETLEESFGGGSLSRTKILGSQISDRFKRTPTDRELFLAKLAAAAAATTGTAAAGVHSTVSDHSYTPIPLETSDEPAVEIYKGERVKHDKFGEGTVTEIVGGVVTVKFDDIRYGTKKLALSIAPLHKLE